jgi:hypothetical protein
MPGPNSTTATLPVPLEDAPHSLHAPTPDSACVRTRLPPQHHKVLLPLTSGVCLTEGVITLLLPTPPRLASV